jgi:hypothetical protein
MYGQVGRRKGRILRRFAKASAPVTPQRRQLPAALYVLDPEPVAEKPFGFSATGW